MEFFHDPAIDQGQLVGGDAVGAGIESMQISQQDAQGIADPAVGVGGLIKELDGERDFFAVIDAGGPQADEVGAVFIVEEFGVDRFVAGFGDFFAG